MGWFYIGALPMLTRYPLRIIFFGVVLGAVFQLLARVLKARERTKRRFELPTLKRLFPLLTGGRFTLQMGCDYRIGGMLFYPIIDL